MTLNGKVALVTGAASGIGKACALALAEAGAQVVAADINAAGAQATADAIAAFQRRAVAVPTDVGDLGQIDTMVKQALAAFGQIDILVNNAGVTRRADIMELTEADWDRIHRVNAKGVFFCLQRVAREMIPKRTGRIINIASIAGKGYAGTSNAAYAASKGAVIRSRDRVAELVAAGAQHLGVRLGELVEHDACHELGLFGVHVVVLNKALPRAVDLRRRDHRRSHIAAGRRAIASMARTLAVFGSIR